MCSVLINKHLLCDNIVMQDLLSVISTGVLKDVFYQTEVI